MNFSQIARSIQCDKAGSCVVFAHEVAKRDPAGVKIISGAVKFRGSILFDHVWVESSGGRVDPTLKQFSFYNLESVEYFPNKSFSPRSYVSTIKRHPDFGRFEELKKV